MQLTWSGTWGGGAGSLCKLDGYHLRQMLDWVQVAWKRQQRAQGHSKWDPVGNPNEEPTGSFRCWWIWQETPFLSYYTCHQRATWRRYWGTWPPGSESSRRLASRSSLLDRSLRSKTTHSSFRSTWTAIYRMSSGSELVLVAVNQRFASLALVHHPDPPVSVHVLQCSCWWQNSSLDSLPLYRFATDDHTRHTGTCNIMMIHAAAPWQ